MRAVVNTREGQAAGKLGDFLASEVAGTHCAMLDGLEACAVEEGVEAALQKFGIAGGWTEADGQTEADEGLELDEQAGARKPGRLSMFRCLRSIKPALEEYKAGNSRQADEQLSLLIKMMKSFYGQADKDLCGEETYREDALMKIMLYTVGADAPKFTVQAMAEVYEKDFQPLWEQLEDFARRLWSNGI